jgi:L-histidine N-alpha-methyltransferase
VGPVYSGAVSGSHPAALSPRFTIDVLISDDDRLAMLRAEARRGLTHTPKELPPKWFYDQRGSALFDEITRLPEYYLTRCERAILFAHAEDIAHITKADTLVELGSGTSDKTRLLLDALDRRRALRRFIPFDVCLPVLEEAGAALLAEYPRVEVHAVVGDFDHHIGRLPVQGRCLVAFLGSTIGNFQPPKRLALYRQLRAVLEPGDFFLLGTDLIKDTGRLNAAYNDAAGVTASFNRNVLRVLNRDLGADFVEEQFQHLATFDPDQSVMDIRLRSLVDQVVTLSALDLRVHFAAREEMRTEISTKFQQAVLERELGSAGFSLSNWWTDPAGDFAVSLWGIS